MVQKAELLCIVQDRTALNVKRSSFLGFAILVSMMRSKVFFSVFLTELILVSLSLLLESHVCKFVYRTTYLAKKCTHAVFHIKVYILFISIKIINIFHFTVFFLFFFLSPKKTAEEYDSVSQQSDKNFLHHICLYAIFSLY